MKKLLTPAAMAIVAIAAMSCGVQHPPVDHGPVTSLWLIPNTPGTSVMYCPHPEQMIGPSCRDLSSVSTYIPSAWPNPSSSQPTGCSNPYKVVVNFADRTKFVYGPCAQPESIAHLHDAIVAGIGAPTSVP